MKFKRIFSRDDAEMGRRQPLPWIADPTISESEVLLAGQNSRDSQEETRALNEKLEENNEKKSKGFPGFKKRHAAAPIELFYDLFFVANLSTFTSSHNISDIAKVESYVGFISLMWFVWLQTTLFDLRFHTDSVLSRVFKALHLGIMIAFSLLAPTFDHAVTPDNIGRLRNMSFVLMAVRLILLLQYASVAWYVRRYKHTAMASIAVIGILLSAAAVFLGLAFAFSNLYNPAKVFIGWYIVSTFEAVAMIGISSFWRVLSFKNTAIVERFSGLTLIVLGEGVVGMMKAANYIVTGTTSPTKSAIGLIIAFVLIMYFIYMIYFDQIEEHRFGTIRQQIWALLHYPLHVAILLSVEGSRAFILYDTGRRIVNAAAESFSIKHTSAGLFEDTVNALKAIVSGITTRLGHNGQVPNFQPSYDKLLNLTMDDPNINEVIDAVWLEIEVGVNVWVMGTFGIPIPEVPGETVMQTDSRIITKTYVLFSFFFIASGVTLVSLAALHWFGKSHKRRGEVLSIICTTVIGIGLALLCIIARTAPPSDTTDIEFLLSPYSIFVDSSWIVPTVLLFFVGIDNFIIWISSRGYYKRVA